MSSKTIIVIRHAEKPDEPAHRNLSEQGKLRALGLTRFSDYLFDYIFVAKSSEISKRPVNTVKPLAKKLKIKINKKFKETNYKKLAKELRKKKYDGMNILICWHHEKIPDLLKSLDAKVPKSLNPWPENLYSAYLVISQSNELKTISVGSQKILYGD